MKPETITKTVCDYLGVTVNIMKCKSRTRVVVYNKKWVIFFLHMYSDLTLKEIAIEASLTNHQTIIYHCRELRDHMERNQEARFHYNNLIDLFTANDAYTHDLSETVYAPI